MNKSTPGKCVALLVSLCCASAFFVHGGEILAAHFHITPESPYVGQSFELRLEIEVTPGAELQDLQLEGVPLDAVAKITPYQKEERRQVQRNNTTVDLLPFVANGRALHPIQQEFHGALHALLVERYNIGFFSSLRSSSATIGLSPLRVTFRALPTDHVPPGFQGAIGTFSLTGAIEPAQAVPGDLVNLTYTLAGHGWLGDAQVLLPQPNPDFRVYPPQETLREETGKLSLRQVVVPLNPRANSIGMARFPYFDPVSGNYRETTAGPFHLNLIASPTNSPVPTVKHVNVLPNPITPAETGDAAVAVTLHQARHLLPLAAVFLLTMILVGLLYEWRPRVAIATGILVFAAGVYICQHRDGKEHPHSREVRELTAARLCPASQARVLFQIVPNRQVTPLENSEAWVRVNCDGRCGWIPVDALKP